MCISGKDHQRPDGSLKTRIGIDICNRYIHWIGLRENLQSTGNRCFYYEIWGFPAKKSLSQSNDTYILDRYYFVTTCQLLRPTKTTATRQAPNRVATASGLPGRGTEKSAGNVSKARKESLKSSKINKWVSTNIYIYIHTFLDLQLTLFFCS